MDKPPDTVTSAGAPSDHLLLSYPRCVWNILKLTVPAGTTVALYYFVQFASLGVVGHELGAGAMAAASVAYFTLSCFFMYPGVGLSFAIDTLCSQIFGADPDSSKQGEVLQRGLVLHYFLFFPTALILINLQPVLAMAFDANTASLAAQWLSYAPFFMGSNWTWYSLSKFLNCQLKQHLVTVSLVVGAVAIFPLSSLLVPLMGIAGASLAMGVSTLLQVVTLAALIYRDPAAAKRFGPMLPLQEILAWEPTWQYLKLGLPSMIFVAAEAGAFDATVIVAGTLGDIPAAAWSATLTTMLMSQSTAAGISVAGSSLVGQAIGASNEALAKRYTIVGPSLAAGIAATASMVVITFHRQVFSVLIDDPAVAAQVTSLLWVLPAFHIFDCVQFAFQGIFSGCGQNSIGAAVLVFSLWIVGVPATWYLGTHYGIVGVCGGLTIGLGIEVPLLILAAVFVFDWKPVDLDQQNGTDSEQQDQPHIAT